MKRGSPFRIVALAGGLFFFAQPCLAEEAADATERIDRIEAAIQESRDRIHEFEKSEKGVFEMLEALDRSAALLKKEVRLARRRVVEARKSVETVEEQRVALEAKQAKTKQAMAKRAVALYKAGEVGPVRILFSSSDLRNLLSASHVLSEMLESDRELLVRFQEENLRLDHIREEVALAVEAERVAQKTVSARMAELQREKEAKRATVAMIRSDRSHERAVLRELGASARALEETLTDLGAKTTKKKFRIWPFKKKEEAPPEKDAQFLEYAFWEQKGKLPPPVEAEIVRYFGKVVDERFNTKTEHNGIDYQAPLGDSVRSVASGDVRFAGWFRGYGKMIILDHGDNFFTISGHLDEVRVDVGDSVPQAAEIGTVGETGSLEGPRLYFEIREGRTPQNPMDWLDPGEAELDSGDQ